MMPRVPSFRPLNLVLFIRTEVMLYCEGLFRAVALNIFCEGWTLGVCPDVKV